MAGGSGSKDLDGKKKYWEKQVEAWRRSGLSQVEFCQEHGLSRWGFLYWRRKLLGNSSSGDTAFVQVSNALEMKLAQRSTISIGIDSRHRIEVAEGFDAATLKQILDVLEERRQL